MIHKYSNETQTRWSHGEFQVQLNTATSDRPMGYCDGTAEDLAELQSLAESEGVDELQIHRKPLKSGREIWTLGGPS